MVYLAFIYKDSKLQWKANPWTPKISGKARQQQQGNSCIGSGFREKYDRISGYLVGFSDPAISMPSIQTNET